VVVGNSLMLGIVGVEVMFNSELTNIRLVNSELNRTPINHIK